MPSEDCRISLAQLEFDIKFFIFNLQGDAWVLNCALWVPAPPGSDRQLLTEGRTKQSGRHAGGFHKQAASLITTVPVIP